MNNIQALLGNTDVYLIDQILKSRYQPGQRILDAGCGSGRNSQWFYDNDFDLHAVDQAEEALVVYKQHYPNVADQVKLSTLDSLPYADAYFDHIICSAVLHFADNHQHFEAMFSELIRVLKPAGTLFIRMTTTFGVEQTAEPLGDGRFLLKDETIRYCISRDELKTVLEQTKSHLIGPFKTTVVEDLRSMSTLLVEKA